MRAFSYHIVNSCSICILSGDCRQIRFASQIKSDSLSVHTIVCKIRFLCPDITTGCCGNTVGSPTWKREKLHPSSHLPKTIRLSSHGRDNLFQLDCPQTVVLCRVALLHFCDTGFDIVVVFCAPSDTQKCYLSGFFTDVQQSRWSGYSSQITKQTSSKFS